MKWHQTCVALFRSLSFFIQRCHSLSHIHSHTDDTKLQDCNLKTNSLKYCNCSSPLLNLWVCEVSQTQRFASMKKKSFICISVDCCRFNSRKQPWKINEHVFLYYFIFTHALILSLPAVWSCIPYPTMKLSRWMTKAWASNVKFKTS